MSNSSRLGDLPPMYNFILNPHTETRVSTCPGCDAKMRQRKVALFIHVDPANPVVMGYTCRYCPDCDLLVAHRDEIESLLANLFAHHKPEIVGNDYLVVGTVEYDVWRRSLKEPMGIPEAIANLHDFKQVWTLNFQPAGWYKDEVIEAEEQARQAARRQFKAETRPKPPRRQRKKRSKRR